MGTRVTIEVLVIVLLVIANGVFAMTEIAILSSRRARMKNLRDEGNHGAEVALELMDDPDDFLSTVQIGITFVGIFAGVFGGATIAEQLGAHLDTIAWIAPHGETVALTITVLSITYLSLVLGELVPKRIALTNRERIAARMAPIMGVIARGARPAVWLLSTSTDFVVKLLRIPPAAEPAVTEEEVTSMLELGRQTGEFHPAEEEMIKGVFALGDRAARSIMTPRHEVIWLDLTEPPETLKQKIVATQLSRYPAAEGNLDHFLGIIEVKDLMARSFAGEPFDPRAALRDPVVFYENTSALEILHDFQTRKTDLGIVVDEYGGFEGIVTVADLATRILGIDEDEPEITLRGDGSWLVDGMIHFEELADAVGMRVEKAGDYDTLAGFILTKLGGRIPKVGEILEAAGFSLEIVDMDGRRIDKVLVMRQGGDGKF